MQKTKVGRRLAAGCLVLLSGCATFGGDMPIRVSGTIPFEAGGGDPGTCSLTMHYAGSGSARSPREVPVNFDVSYVIAAKKQAYYFTAACKDASEYRSKNIEAGGKGTFNGRFDLGVLAKVEGHP